MISPTRENIEKICQEFIDKLTEHEVDSVRLFVTWREEGETDSITQGGGNVYAQGEQIREWIALQDAQVGAYIEKQLEGEEEEEEEEP